MSRGAIFSFQRRVQEVDAQRRADREHLDEIFFKVEHYGDSTLERLILYDMVEPDYVNKLRNPKGDTLLHYAAKCGKAKVVQTLLAMGADPEAKDAEGKKAEEVICTRLYTQSGAFPEVEKLKHDYYKDHLAGSAVFNEQVIFGSCQDPAFSLYAAILDIFKAAEAVRAQAEPLQI